MKTYAALLVSALLCTAAVGCAPAESDGAGNGSATSGADLTGSGSGWAIVATATDVAPDSSKPNVARELTETLDAKFVTGQTATIPGVLEATYFVPAMHGHAATLSLASWSSVTTTGPNWVPGSRLYVMVTGKTAQAIFDAMTRAPTTLESGVQVRRSAMGSVTCDASPDATHRCFLGPVDTVEPATH